MTFEESLDRLKERHEALAQSLELLVGMQKENERRFADTDRRIAELSAETNRRFGETLQFINQLARVAEVHEHRLDRIEGQ